MKEEKQDDEIQQVVTGLLALPHEVLLRQLTYWSADIENGEYGMNFKQAYMEWKEMTDCYAAAETEQLRYMHAGCMALKMGKRDDRYTLKGCIEHDEGFFSTEMPMEQKNEKLKAGAGSQRKSKVLVIAESTPEEKPNSGQKPKSVGHIKMIVIPDAKATTIDAAVSRVIEGESSITTNASSSHIHFKDMFTEHTSQVIDPRDIGKVLPWVHIAIANAKTLLADMYHGVKPEFLQEYLNEFCYKFNRRYFGEDLFERLVMIAASCRTDFEHRTYRKAA